MAHAQNNVVRQLSTRIAAIEQPPQADGGRAVPTGWAAVDAGLGGGLACGTIHEWLGPGAADNEKPRGRWRKSRREWTGPLCILAHLAWQMLDAPLSLPGRTIVWIGRRCFPDGNALVRDGDRRLLDQSLFVEAGDAATRLWAAEAAVRCQAVAGVIVDGAGWPIAATRRLQLAAQDRGSIVLLARPMEQAGELSVARTRWLVRLRSSERPAWEIELRRCKGAHGGARDGSRWALEFDHAKGLVAIPTALGGRESASTLRPARAARQRLA